MTVNKAELLKLDAESKRELAFELLNSIDEEYIQKDFPEWKRQLILERIMKDESDKSDAIPWDEFRKKYSL